VWRGNSRAGSPRRETTLVSVMKYLDEWIAERNVD